MDTGIWILPIIFILGYLAIALEHPLRVDKAAPALLAGGLIWAMLAIFGSQGDHHFYSHAVEHHLSEIASILFFLLAAMAIVELIDVNEGFRFITDKINTRNPATLTIIIGVLSFFLSAALDNMTTAIVIAALLRKFLKNKEDVWKFAGLTVICANAGGAWSPIGDVTTIMLWVGGQVTAQSIVQSIILPSLVCAAVPILWFSLLKNRGELELKDVSTQNEDGDSANLSRFEKNLVFFLGVGGLLFIPIFKSVTGLQPFIGAGIALGLLWVVTEFIHRRHSKWEARKHMTVTGALKKVEFSTLLFFLGILLAVGGLQTAGHLTLLAEGLDRHVGNIYAINGIIGVLSSIVDNVPLVAAAMGMYGIETYPADSAFWELLALCAGTGGSILIIGSAAGVAAMGILHIPFVWYLRKMALPAFLGYIASIATYWLLNM